jgi:hypothetical protein
MDDAHKSDGVWGRLAAAAESAGLNVRVAVTRAPVDAAFAQARERARAAGPSLPVRTAPADWCPGYRAALVLGSAGRTLWERLRRTLAGGAGSTGAPAEPERADPDPVDRLTERTVAPLLALLREADSAAQSAFPFRHARQIVPFQALTQHLPWATPQPLGLLVHPRVGPWFAWRAVLLTTLEAPAAWAEARASPCVTCPAPCVTACPSQAVDKAGFRWGDCVDYRLRERPCRATCLARQACPAGADFRYGADQLAYHYGASLRMLRRWAEEQGRDAPG